MFLIDSSNEMVTSHSDLVVEKISRPSQTPGSSRHRLLDLLNQGMTSCASTILIGRAGTGKTALVVDFGLKCGRRMAWYKVDAPDAEIPVFFRYLIASLQTVLPKFEGKSLQQMLPEVKPEQMPLLAEALVYELAELDSEPILFVIEDLHLICDAGWVVPFFQRLLPLLPSHIHLIITSRTMPPAPLWRMRSKQTLLVIDEETLAFTRKEATELFESYGLSPEQASIAVDHTHGRAALLMTFAQSLEGQRKRKVSLTADTQQLPRLLS